MLEGESDLFAGYWSAMLSAVARDTVTRVAFEADGPLRADRPVTLALLAPDRSREPMAGGAKGGPRVAVLSPSGARDTIALARDPFDARRWTGRYWPRESGWHALELTGGRRVPFRVTSSGEWTGLEAKARLTATLAHLGQASGAPTGSTPGGQRLVLFGLLILALTWLWVESRLRA